MKKLAFFFLLLLMATVSAKAQSGMTDNQVMAFVLKEHNAGTSQAQIVTKLMQRGVDIQQIRRVRQKYESMQKGNAVGYVSDGESKVDDSRMRKNNGKKKTAGSSLIDAQTEDDSNMSNSRLQDFRKSKQGGKGGKQYTNEDQLAMESELGLFMPTDTATLVKQLMEERERERKRCLDATSSTTQNSPSSPI